MKIHNDSIELTSNQELRDFQNHGTLLHREVLEMAKRIARDFRHDVFIYDPKGSTLNEVTPDGRVRGQR